MEFKRLGNTDFNVSVLGFGCMSLKRCSNRESAYLIAQAAATGINLFDTADLYEKGANEEKLGAALKSVRNTVYIATKAGNQWNPDGEGWSWNPRRKHLLKAVEESLKRLQTDYIDLYQLHGGTIDDPFDEIIETFELLKQQGKIRAWGISSIRPNVIREYVQRDSMASVMLQYSLLDRRPEASVLPLLGSSGKAVLVRGALAQGLLVNKAPAEYTGYTAPEVKKLQQMIRHLCGARYTPQQLALAFVLSNPAVSTVVAGIRTREQLEALMPPYITDEAVLTELKHVLPANHYEQHC